MAAKAAPKKAPAKKKPLAQRKVARAEKAGYTGAGGATAADAQASVTRQYGLVKNENGKWVKPGMAFLTSQMEFNGWGPLAQAGALNEEGTPINIGGARWYSGKNGVVFSGQRSDSAKQNPGADYLSGNQTTYKATGLNKANKKGQKGRGGKPKPGLGGSAPADEAAAAAEAFVPYAEADTTTTGMARAQGKAYARGKGYGSGLMGQTSTPPGESTVVEEAASGGGGKRKPRKHKPKKKRIGKAPGKRALRTRAK